MLQKLKGRKDNSREHAHHHPYKKSRGRWLRWVGFPKLNKMPNGLENVQGHQRPKTKTKIEINKMGNTKVYKETIRKLKKDTPLEMNQNI